MTFSLFLPICPLGIPNPPGLPTLLPAVLKMIWRFIPLNYTNIYLSPLASQKLELFAVSKTQNIFNIKFFHLGSAADVSVMQSALIGSQ